MLQFCCVLRKCSVVHSKAATAARGACTAGCQNHAWKWVTHLLKSAMILHALLNTSSVFRLISSCAIVASALEEPDTTTKRCWVYLYSPSQAFRCAW